MSERGADRGQVEEGEGEPASWWTWDCWHVRHTPIAVSIARVSAQHPYVHCQPSIYQGYCQSGQLPLLRNKQTKRAVINDGSLLELHANKASQV